MKNRFITIAVLGAALLGVAATAPAATDPTYGANAYYEAQFDGIGVTYVNKASLAGRVYSTTTSYAPGAVATKSYSTATNASAELDLPASGVLMLAQTISDFSAGRMPTLSTQVHAIGGDPAMPQWTDLGGCTIAYIKFPRLSAADKAPGFVTLSLNPAVYASLTAPRAMNPGPPAPAPALFNTGQFSVSIPGIDCSHVLAVDGIMMESHLNHRQSFGQDQLGHVTPPVGVNNWNITIQAAGVSARGLKEWMNALNGGVSAKRDVTIQLLTPSLQGTVFTLRGTGVGLLSVHAMAEQPDVTSRVEAELFVERWEVVVPSAKKDKSQLMVPAPGLTLPGTRK